MKIMPDTVWRPGEIIDFTVCGNRAELALLGWSKAEKWGSWSDGLDATVSFRWPEALRSPVFVSVECFYAARADIILLLNDREIGVLPGFQEEEMRREAVASSLLRRKTPLEPTF